MDTWKDELRQALIEALLHWGGEATYEELGLTQVEAEDLAEHYILPGLSLAVAEAMEEHEGEISIVHTAESTAMDLCRWADVAVREEYPMYRLIKTLCAYMDGSNETSLG